ncbi:MAG: right-handed parallel beta-helix repeat-containing protein [Candidatus Poribacteria bacterium]|nr:right-handed parallel beta-helix repeat-containing protein [Candidatus Poribacteria bacterium]
MKKRSIYYLLIFCLGLAVGTSCTTQETSNPTTLENNSEVVLENYRLTGDETWESEKTYVVHGTLEIPRDMTLNIPPGTTVKFRRNAFVTVKGILKIGAPLAQEQVTQLVYLTSDNIGPAPGDWNGIFFDHTHDLESFIRGTVIEYATVALDVKTTSPTVAECTLRFNETAIALDGSDARVRYNDIVDNGIGISTIGRQTLPRIEKNNIAKNETGIFCENVQSTIQHNNLNANIFALRLNVKFDLVVINNWWGHSDPTEIANVIIDGGDPGLIAKQIGTVHYEPFTDVRIVDAGFPYSTLLAELGK